MAARLTAYIVTLIVAGTFIAGLIVGAQRDDNSGPVDLIVYNAAVHTGAGSEPAEAVAVRGNRILRVGSNREIKRLRRAQTTSIDAGGAALLPGFVDTHVHLLSGGLSIVGPAAVPRASAPPPAARPVAAPTRDDRLRALRAGIEEAHRLGVTSVQNAGGSPEDLELFDEIRREGDLKLRVYAALAAGPELTERDADRLDAIRARYPEDPVFKTGAVKLVPAYTQAELNRVVSLLDRRGWQILIHATGDRGVRMALNAYEQAAAENPPPERGRRHRIEHVERADPADLPRFGRLGVIAAMQPSQSSHALNAPGIWAAGGGAIRAGRTWPFHDIAVGGGRLAFGSDWPARSLDPRLGLQAAVTRTTPDDPAAGDGHAMAAISLETAVDAYTSEAAYASFDEHRKGRVAPGMLADLVILSADIFSLPPDRLLDAVVTTTIFDGQIVYSRPAPELTE